MQRTASDCRRLKAELLEDLAQSRQAKSLNERAYKRVQQGSADELEVAALGWTIHNLYGLVENACYRIAKFFENHLDSEAWHQELLDRMKLEIPGLRLAFFNAEAHLLFDELRAFRQVFRNLYARPLKPEKVLTVQALVPDAC